MNDCELTEKSCHSDFRTKSPKFVKIVHNFDIKPLRVRSGTAEEQERGIKQVSQILVDERTNRKPISSKKR